MRETDEWQDNYWRYINEHDPVGGERPKGDYWKSESQIAEEAIRYADSQYNR